MKERKNAIMEFFPVKSDGNLDIELLCTTREWPCLLAMVIEQSSEGVAVINLEGIIQYTNKSFASNHGYNHKSLIGKHISIFHTPEQMASVQRANKQIKKTGFFSGEIWHVRKDGSVFPTLMQNTILKDDEGKTVGMIGTVRDISELKKTQKRLEESHNQLEEMVQKQTSKLLRANKKLQLGLTEKEKTEKKLKEFSTLLEEQKASVERKNIALQEILEQLHTEKEQIKNNVMENVKNILIPVIHRMKKGSRKYEKSDLAILEKELKSLTSGFGRSVSDKKLMLTPREIEICNMIRNGLTSKDISRTLGLSKKTVDGHRYRIRNKLGIRNNKYNLSSVLQHLE